jgi:hypothetical protein
MAHSWREDFGNGIEKAVHPTNIKSSGDDESKCFKAKFELGVTSLLTAGAHSSFWESDVSGCY